MNEHRGYTLKEIDERAKELAQRLGRDNPITIRHTTPQPRKTTTRKPPKTPPRYGPGTKNATDHNGIREWLATNQPATAQQASQALGIHLGTAAATLTRLQHHGITMRNPTNRHQWQLNPNHTDKPD